MTEVKLTDDQAKSIKTFRFALEDVCLRDAILCYAAGRSNVTRVSLTNERVHKTAMDKIRETDDEHLAEAASPIIFLLNAVSGCGYYISSSLIPNRNMMIEVANRHWDHVKLVSENPELLQEVL